MEVFITKTHFGFIPATDKDKEVISKIPKDETFKIKLKRARNVDHHRKFFALLQLVFDNLPEDFVLTSADGQVMKINSVDDLLVQLKFQTSHFDTVITLGGKVTYIPRSISFASMTQDNFNVFYDRCIKVILKYFLVGTKKEELEEMVALEF